MSEVKDNSDEVSHVQEKIDYSQSVLKRITYNPVGSSTAVLSDANSPKVAFNLHTDTVYNVPRSYVELTLDGTAVASKPAFIFPERAVEEVKIDANGVVLARNDNCVETAMYLNPIFTKRGDGLEDIANTYQMNQVDFKPIREVGGVVTSALATEYVVGDNGFKKTLTMDALGDNNEWLPYSNSFAQAPQSARRITQTVNDFTITVRISLAELFGKNSFFGKERLFSFMNQSAKLTLGLSRIRHFLAQSAAAAPILNATATSLEAFAGTCSVSNIELHMYEEMNTGLAQSIRQQINGKVLNMRANYITSRALAAATAVNVTENLPASEGSDFTSVFSVIENASESCWERSSNNLGGAHVSDVVIKLNSKRLYESNHSSSDHYDAVARDLLKGSLCSHLREYQAHANMWMAYLGSSSLPLVDRENDDFSGAPLDSDVNYSFACIKLAMTCNLVNMFEVTKQVQFTGGRWTATGV